MAHAIVILKCYDKGQNTKLCATHITFVDVTIFGLRPGVLYVRVESNGSCCQSNESTFAMIRISWSKQNDDQSHDISGVYCLPDKIFVQQVDDPNDFVFLIILHKVFD